jgi:hypothetical protein
MTLVNTLEKGIRSTIGFSSHQSFLISRAPEMGLFTTTTANSKCCQENKMKKKTVHYSGHQNLSSSGYCLYLKHERTRTTSY